MRQCFTGELEGAALLIFPSANSLQLVRELLHDDAPLETLPQLEQETLLDVGNIILNAFLASFTQMLSFDFDFAQAEFLRVDADALFHSEALAALPAASSEVSPGLWQDQRVIFLIMNFHTADEANEIGTTLQGYVVLLFSSAAMQTLRKDLQRILSQY
ncbi:MAG: hypothetical protein HQL51_12030 [Magnetococcales bacterium]|nr:hypothetical protein [Magnetococcales bacterium]